MLSERELHPLSMVVGSRKKVNASENAYNIVYVKEKETVLVLCLRFSRFNHTSSEVKPMHSKQTVKYVRERYLSGNSYYYKQEMITHNSWEDISSLQWGRKRPITKGTFEKRKREGYRIVDILIERPPAEIIPFKKNTQ
ncbi:MAG: hypothetical protein LRY73_03205 [Bacillus sp. (in: Bacteria)]|nr:hypothetical protein [Bacillus sp. (in: firmicutes)]